MSRFDYQAPKDPAPPRKAKGPRKTKPTMRQCARCFNKFPIAQGGLYCGDRRRRAIFAFTERMVRQREEL